MGRGSGNGVGGGAGGWPRLSPSSLKQETSIYFPRLNICMLKRRSSFVDLSGMHFLLDRAGCPVKDKATSLALSSHLFIRHSPLSQKIGEARARLLRPWAAAWQRAESSGCLLAAQVGWAACASAVLRPGEAFFSTRYQTHQHPSSRHWPKYRQWLQGGKKSCTFFYTCKRCRALQTSTGNEEQ